MSRISLLKSMTALTVLSLTGALFLFGCHSSSESKDGDDSKKPVSASIFPPPPEKSGSQLWAENCSRCHNIRPPEQYSDAQWSVIVHHMRLRANLTGAEARKVTEFLQASN